MVLTPACTVPSLVKLPAVAIDTAALAVVNIFKFAPTFTNTLPAAVIAFAVPFHWSVPDVPPPTVRLFTVTT